MPSLDVVVVNWNTGKQLFDCLSSVLTIDHSGFHLETIIIVDNASSDASMLGIEAIDLPLKIIKNSQNRGFGAACNQGVAEGRADYILFLNPDTCLFSESLSKPISFMDVPENSNVGICGVQLTDENHKVSTSCSYFPSLGFFLAKSIGLTFLLPRRLRRKLPYHAMTNWDHSESMPVDQVMGAFFLIRRSLFESLNGFDERFFVYFEEVDLSFRAAQKGFISYYLSDVQAFHRGCGSSEKVKAYRLFYSLRSRIKYGYKHFSRLKATLLLLVTLLMEPLSRILYALRRGSVDDVKNILSGYRMLWQSLPETLRAPSPHLSPKHHSP